MKKIYIFIAALVTALLACSILGGGTTTGGGSAKVLFSDDFSDTGSGWDQQTYADIGGTDYYEGGYRINVVATASDVWANPGRTFQNDVRIEVDATKFSGTDDNDFGVVCRYQDAGNFYYFHVTSDGFAAIGKNQGSSMSLISGSDYNSIDSVNAGNSSNHIRADCIGGQLSLYVNGDLVAQATDSSFTGGDVGLIAGTFDEVPVDILFDNFFVYAP